MEITLAALERFQVATKAAQQKIVDLMLDLKKAEQRLNANTLLLKQSNDDIRVLMLFIKRKDLHPPKIQSQFVN